MSKLLMLKGLPASGKSTHARELVNQGWKRVNKDDLRAMIDNSNWSKKNENEIKEWENTMVSAFLLAGYNVVVDDTNFAYEDHWREVAESKDAEFEVKFFDTPLPECIERDAKRGEKSVGKKVIMQMYERYLKPKPIPYNPDLPDCYIFDIDGTLAHMNNRNPYDYSKVSTDFPDRNVSLTFLLLKLGLKHYSESFESKMFIFSGREDSCRPDTEAWLNKHGVFYDQLIMRKEGDERNDAIIKKEIYEEYIKGKYNVLGIFDDRQRVVDMWRSLGLPCFQVAYGDF